MYHESDPGWAGYPTLKRLHGKIWPWLRGLPGQADQATRLGGSPHVSCKRNLTKTRDAFPRWNFCCCCVLALKKKQIPTGKDNVHVRMLQMNSSRLLTQIILIWLFPFLIFLRQGHCNYISCILPSQLWFSPWSRRFLRLPELVKAAWTPILPVISPPHQLCLTTMQRRWEK